MFAPSVTHVTPIATGYPGRRSGCPAVFFVGCDGEQSYDQARFEQGGGEPTPL